MEDLDSLLEDLGRGKSTSTVKKQRPPSSRVDLNELENLMEDLAAPSPKPVPEVISTATVNSTFTPPRTQNPPPQSYSDPPQVNTSRPTSVTQSQPQSYSQPPPKTTTPTPTPTPTTTNNAPSANIDDLDALMESLNASSSRSQRRSVIPSSNSSLSPSSSLASSSSSSSSSSYQEPPKQNVYTPPPQTNTYTPPPQERKPEPTPTYTQPPTNTTRTTTTTNNYTAPPKKNDDLDSLLQNLNSQMNNIDLDNPSSRGVCWTCKGNILGEIIQALGKSFHPEHFTCGNCRTPLGTRSFYEHNGSPHCENCYQELFCPKCAHCDQPVLDRCITALGKKWHVDHFICTQCLKPFAGGNFFEKDGRPYCETDFYGLYAPKCAHCNEAIRGDCINALGSQWHPEHFVCSYCEKSFQGGSFFEYGGKPYCETHYHQQTGSLCSGCGKPITGRCVNALDKKWHPEHFVCAFCMNPLAGGSFTEHNNKAYCKECHGKLFSG